MSAYDPKRTLQSVAPYCCIPICYAQSQLASSRAIIGMRRRDLIKAITASAAAWPLAARAEQSRIPVIGFLRSSSAARGAHHVTACGRRLKEGGVVERLNVGLDYRWSN